MMIDAGSSGSRMHVYEFHSRVLRGKKEITEAVSGRKLSYPDTNSRWTERLRPGIATFASLPDDQLFGVSSFRCLCCRIINANQNLSKTGRC